MNTSRLARAALAAAFCLAAWTASAQDKPAGLDPERLKAALPAAWEGYERSGPDYELLKMPGAGEVGRASARYRDKRGGTNYFEAFLRLDDMGLKAGKMYQDYAADYLKGPVENETQKSVTVKGLPGLTTMTGEDHMQVETFIAPRLHLTASCLKAQVTECITAIERVDFDALKALAAQ